MIDDADAVRSSRQEVVLTNHIVLRLYAAVGSEDRRRIIDMLQTAYTGSCDITGVMTGMPGIEMAEIKISDSVATAVVQFEDGTTLRDSRIVLRQKLPATMMQAVRSGPLNAIVSHPLFEGFRCHGIEERDEDTVLRFDWGVTTIHETPKDVPLSRWIR